MIIVAHNGLLTVASPWWTQFRINPENKHEVLLQKIDTDGDVVASMTIAKFRSNKRAVELFNALRAAVKLEFTRFDIKKWEDEYSATESSNSSLKSP